MVTFGNPRRIVLWLKSMAMQFSLEYCIDPKVHRAEEDMKAIAVEVAIGQNPSRMKKLAGSDLKMGGVPPEHLKRCSSILLNAYAIKIS